MRGYEMITKIFKINIWLIHRVEHRHCSVNQQEKGRKLSGKWAKMKTEFTGESCINTANDAQNH